MDHNFNKLFNKYQRAWSANYLGSIWCLLLITYLGSLIKECRVSKEGLTRGWNGWFATFEGVYPVNLRLERTKSFFVYFGLWSWISKKQKCTYCRLSNLKGLNTAVWKPGHCFHFELYCNSYYESDMRKQAMNLRNKSEIRKSSSC